MLFERFWRSKSGISGPIFYIITTSSTCYITTGMTKEDGLALLLKEKGEGALADLETIEIGKSELEAEKKARESGKPVERLGVID